MWSEIFRMPPDDMWNTTQPAKFNTVVYTWGICVSLSGQTDYSGLIHSMSSPLPPDTTILYDFLVRFTLEQKPLRVSHAISIEGAVCSSAGKIVEKAFHALFSILGSMFNVSKEVRSGHERLSWQKFHHDTFEKESVKWRNHL